jgi:hypothetical protein
VIDFTDKMWVEHLETRIKSDTDSGKVPVALLMNTGSLSVFNDFLLFIIDSEDEI